MKIPDRGFPRAARLRLVRLDQGRLAFLLLARFALRLDPSTINHQPPSLLSAAVPQDRRRHHL